MLSALVCAWLAPAQAASFTGSGSGANVGAACQAAQSDARRQTRNPGIVHAPPAPVTSGARAHYSDPLGMPLTGTYSGCHCAGGGTTPLRCSVRLSLRSD